MTSPGARLRIAYLVSGPGGPENGVFSKIRTQTAIWADCGVEPRIFARTDRSSAASWSDLGAVVSVAAGSRPWSRYAARTELIHTVRRWRPDLVYLRQTAFSPDLARLTRAVPTVIEVNSDDVAEAAFASRGKRAYLAATRGLLLRRAAGIAFVSEELRRSPRFPTDGRPSIVIPNSIDLPAVPSLPWVDHPGVRLLFVGQRGGRVWHGLDRLASIARALPEWSIDVVGSERREWPGSPANMRFHGQLPASAYRELALTADAAVGSLALFRNGMHEASPLKVREYLAYGLPVIGAYRDSHFPDGAPFLLTLPGDDRDLAAFRDDIAQFVAAWRGRRVPRTDVMAIDAAANEARRVEFLRSLGRRSPGRPSLRA